MRMSADERTRQNCEWAAKRAKEMHSYFSDKVKPNLSASEWRTLMDVSRRLGYTRRVCGRVSPALRQPVASGQVEVRLSPVHRNHKNEPVYEYRLKQEGN